MALFAPVLPLLREAFVTPGWVSDNTFTPELIEHSVRALVGQRVFALALGYEDLVDHDDLTMAVLAGKCSVIPTGRSTADRDQLRLGGGKEPAADIGCAADIGLERGLGPDQGAHRGGGNIG